MPPPTDICIIGMDDALPMERFDKAFGLVAREAKLHYLGHNQPRLLAHLRSLRPKGIILSGSAYRIGKAGSPTLPKKILDMGIPVLGICYGFEWMAKAVGGSICTFADGALHEYRKVLDVRAPFETSKRCWYRFSHHDYVCGLPASWTKHMEGPDGQIWMASDAQRKHVGIQFHPELHASSAAAFFATWLDWIQYE